MSLSKPRATTSPVQRRFDLKLSTGEVTYYHSDDKKTVSVTEAPGDWQQDETVKLSPAFKFVVLDVLNFIGGFSDAKQSGIWSNETRSTRDEEFVVRTRSGVIAEGLYEAIKGSAKEAGGKFGNSLYLAYRDGGEWKLGNLKLIGAGVSAFFDFKKGKFFDTDPGVAIAGWTAKKTGRNTYWVPVFESWDVGAADLSAASALDETLQQFLGAVPAKADVEESDDDFTDEPPF